MSVATTVANRALGAVPPVGDLAKLAAAGFVGLIAWEVFARFITPLVLGGPLQPYGLVISLFQSVLGFNPGRTAAEVVHYATGIAFYPLGYLVLLRVGRLGWAVTGLAWGAITWFLALGVFASIAGLPFMLNWGNLTWMSLIGHVAYAAVAAATFAALTGRR